MTDDEILAALRDARGQTAVGRFELLGRLLGRPARQGDLITYFKRAYPELPLRTLLDCGAWHRVSGGTMTDDDVEQALG